jgi:hypothetical protein
MNRPSSSRQKILAELILRSREAASRTREGG